MTKLRPHARISAFLFVVFWLFPVLGCDAFAQQLSPATEAKIRAVLDSPQLADGHIGLSILDLGEVENANSFPANPAAEPRVLLEHDAQKKFMPASNMKLFTAAIALARIGMANRFATDVFVAEKLGSNWRENNGVLRGDLYLVGGGDPSFTLANLENLARRAGQLGIKRIEGDVVVDDQKFSGETYGGRYPDGWTLDDTLWYYGPPVSALALNRNQVDVTFTGGANPGDAARVKIEPPCAQIEIENRASTSSAEGSLDWERDERNGKIVYTVTGNLRPGQSVLQGVAVPDPGLWAAEYFKRYLEESGVAVSGAAREGSWKTALANETQAPLAQHISPDLQTLLLRLLKSSDNLYAEMLLRDAALYSDGTGGSKAASRAHRLLREWLQEQNVEAASARFSDGSGLSRYNLLTPRATAQLLVAINRMPQGEAIWNALPIAGVDGTLRLRMRSTPAAGNARAKTGSFSTVSTLSGYITTQNKRRLVVSMYTNFVRDTATARWAQNEIFTALAAADS